MDARQLEYFLAIVDHDGFGRAAQHLHIAQPSLSQTIAGLERELGVPLFHRIGRGVVLSPAGGELIGPARQVLRDLRTARATMESMKGITRGRVELVTMPSPGIEPLATLTRRFTRRHPGITVAAEAAFTPDEVVTHGAPGGVRARAGRHPGRDQRARDRRAGAGAAAVRARRAGPTGTSRSGDPVPHAALAGTRMIARRRGQPDAPDRRRPAGRRGRAARSSPRWRTGRRSCRWCCRASG